jgi:hypothetical protein
MMATLDSAPDRQVGTAEPDDDSHTTTGCSYSWNRVTAKTAGEVSNIVPHAVEYRRGGVERMRSDERYECKKENTDHRTTQ